MKKILSLFVLFLLITVLPASALAEGDGDGTGGGSSEPLMLASSSVPDGSVDVPVDTIITLTFSKNVVNMSVRDNNQTCFAMSDSSGNDVAISVLMGDDQVDPSIKRIIEIQPQAELTPDTTYTLTISQSVTSKSGVQLESDVMLTFTTVGAPEPAPETAIESSEPHSDTSTPETDAAAETAATDEASPEPSPEPYDPTAVSPAVTPSPEASSPSPSNDSDENAVLSTDNIEASSESVPASPIDDENDSADVEAANYSWLIYVAAGAVVVVVVSVLVIRHSKKK